MDNLKKEITREELDRGLPLGNHVLCEAYYSNRDAKTKAGVIVGFNEDLIFSDAEGKDTSSHMADLAPTSMVVYRCPLKLYFDPEDPKGMDWETEMELQQGDQIFTNPIDALNCVTLVCEEKEYKLIHYSDIYVAKGYRWRHEPGSVPKGNMAIPQDKRMKVIVLNGYVLLEQVYKKKLSDLDISSEDKIEPKQGIVAYFGKPNARYRSPEIEDFYDLRLGDKVLYGRKAAPFLLERLSHVAKFSEKPYMVLQRRYIDMVMERRRSET
jgi:hypothetical protein